MNAKAIRVFARWQVQEGKLETVLLLLKEVAQRSREEKGNLFYQLHQSTADANLLILHEAYEDEAAVNEHRQSGHFQEIVIGRIIPLLENREVILTTVLSE